MSSLALVRYGITRDQAEFRRATRTWAEGMARGWGMRVHTHGASLLDAHGTYVFMANHLSHADIVALFLGLPMNVGFLAKKELRRVPFLAQAMVAGGHVFIDRSKRADAVQAMQEAADSVREGASLVIFPEGTRGLSEVIQPFKKGGFHLARQAGVPVVPVGLRGTRAIMGREDLVIRPGDVHMHIGAPVDPGAFPDVNKFADHVRREVARLSAMPLAD